MRDENGLRRALTELDDLTVEAGQRSARITNMLIAARLICEAALQRHESRGGHYREDYPASDPAQQSRSFFYPSSMGAQKQKARARA